MKDYRGCNMWKSFYGRSIWKYFIDEQEKEIILVVGHYKDNSGQIDYWSGHIIHTSRKANDGFESRAIKDKNLSIVKLKTLMSAKQYGYNVSKVIC